MKKGAKYYEKILSFLEQDFFGENRPFIRSDDGDDPCLPGVNGKLLEAVEFAFLRDLIPDEWERDEKGCKIRFTSWTKEHGWSGKTDGTVVHPMRLPGADDWEYIMPMDEMYNTDDIFYNYLEMSDSSIPFDLAVTGCQDLASFHTDEDLVRYYKEGSWRKDAKDSFKDLYFGYYGEEDVDGSGEDDEDEESDTYDDFHMPPMVNSILGMFYLYHLTVAPLPKEVLDLMAKEGFNFSYFNKAAGKILDIMTCLGEPEWTDAAYPAVLTDAERFFAGLAIDSLFGLAEPCVCSWKSDRVAQYLLKREFIPKRWRKVLDGLFKRLTGYGPKDSDVVGRRYQDGHLWAEQRFGVIDGSFYSVTQLPQGCLISPGTRLALAAFTGAYEEAVAAADKVESHACVKGRAC